MTVAEMSPLAVAAARLAAAEAKALAPHDGLLRVIDPSGTVRSELRLSAEGAGREAALQEYYAGKVSGLRAELERADARAVRTHADHLTTMDTLQEYVVRCKELVAAVGDAQQRAGKAEGEMGTANCNIYANSFRIFLLKMQKEWRIALEKRCILY